jgi:hypothetical protein
LNDSLIMQYFIIGSLVLFIFLATILISFLKKQKNNVPLWSSIFEGVTMGLVNLDEHKNPDTKIERKAKRDGKEELSNNFIDPESIPAREKD